MKAISTVRFPAVLLTNLYKTVQAILTFVKSVNEILASKWGMFFSLDNKWR